MMKFREEVIDRNITYRYYDVDEITDTMSACEWMVKARNVFDPLQRLRIRKDDNKGVDFALDVPAERLCKAITEEHKQIDALGIYKGAHIYIIIYLNDFTVAFVRQNREEYVFLDLEKELINL